MAQPALQVIDRSGARLPRAFLARVVAAALRHCRARRPVSLLLCSDREIARLHGTFLGDGTPTDVITFELEGTAEIAISVETARRRARMHGGSVRNEVALYLVHGVLHACGYDDTTTQKRARMRRAERSVLGALGIAFAPVDE